MMLIVLLSVFVSYIAAQDVQCGVPLIAPKENRIVGGEDAVAGSWPWMALLVDDFGYLAGSGFIINEHVIVTAAQIFESVHMDPTYSDPTCCKACNFPNDKDDIKSNILLELNFEHRRPSWYFSLHDLDLIRWRVYTGEHDVSLKDPNENWYHIRRVLIHPGYNTTSLEHAIALIVTIEPIVYNNHTSPSCIPVAMGEPEVGQQCYLPGWGFTAGTGDELILNQVNLPLAGDEVCSQHWNEYLADTQICAGYENGGKAFCAGDLGSPLMCKNAESGSWYAHGIATGGGNCTAADEPGVFVDVDVYAEWIITTMEQAGYPYEY